jgi:purine catabolism regulator
MDITLGDVVAWAGDDLSIIGEPGVANDALRRVVSWAVTIRATQPVLPPLRGGELIVVPQRVLEDLNAAELVGWPSIQDQLGRQRIAGVITETGHTGLDTLDIPRLEAAPAFVAEAEAILNRLITERRADLYRVGADLSRALSSISLAGGGPEALITAAQRVAGRAIALLDEQGAALAVAPLGLRWREGAFEHVRQSDGDRVTFDLLNRRWLAEPMPNTSLGTRGWLAVEMSGAYPDVLARLAVGEVVNGLGMLAQGRATSIDPGSRQVAAQRALRELLVAQPGTLTPGELRRLAVEVGLDQPARLGLLTTPEARFAWPERGLFPWLSARPSEREHVVLLPPALHRADWSVLESIVRRESSDHVPARLIISGPVEAIEALPGTLAELRALARLYDAQVLDGPLVVDAAVSASARLEAFLSPIWVPGIASGDLRARFAELAEQLVKPLVLYDESRSGDLVRTLDAFLASGGSTTLAAAALDAHRNTVSYRLGRIANLTGRDPHSPEQRVLFRLARAAWVLNRTLSSLD